MRIFFTDALGNPIFGFRRRHHHHHSQPLTATTYRSSILISPHQHHAHQKQQQQQQAARYYTDAPTRTTLCYYILNRNWDWVVRRSRTHPQEVFYYDGRTGDTPLHAACRLNPPPHVVRALLSVSSRATAHELVYNKDGWTALHVAASNHCSRAVLEVLVEHAPDAVCQLTRKTKRAPIHCATASFRGLDREAFFYLLNISLTRTLVQPQPDDDDEEEEETDHEKASSSDNLDDTEVSEDPQTLLEELDHYHGSKKRPSTTGSTSSSAASGGTNLLCLKDGTGQTPLALLFKKYRERVRHVCQQMDQLHLSRNDALELVQTELGNLWHKARSLVERLSAVLSSSENKAARTMANEAAAHVDSEDENFSGTTTPLYHSTNPRSILNHSHHHSHHHNNHTNHHHPNSRRLSHRRLSAILKFRSRSSLQGRRFRLVHASVGLIRFGCPPEMIRLAVSLYPHQVSEVDEDGNLPLHIAAMAFHEQAVATAQAEELAALLSLEEDASSLQTLNSHNNNNSLHTLNNSGSNWDTMSAISETTTAASSLAGFSNRKSLWDQVFDMLLQQYPEGARTPQQPPRATTTTTHKRRGGGARQPAPVAALPYYSLEDTLPLVLAMKSCTHTMSWQRDGLERLMHAYAPALHFILDGTTTQTVTARSSTAILPTSSHHCYPHLFALLLAPDHELEHLLRSGRSCSFRRFTNGRRPLRPRSIRMDPSKRRRTPLDIARMSSVFRLLQTKPEMIATAAGRTRTSTHA